MAHKKNNTVRPSHYCLAWLVHLFTASAACAGVWTLLSIHEGLYTNALWLMAAAIVIDAIDGSFARRVGVKTILPGLDGALLDNIVDYLNYVITPCFFLLAVPGMLPIQGAGFIVVIIAITSAYQFCQSDAKTADHFFKGFPCYWNIVVFYLFLFSTSALFNAVFLCILAVLVFVPIKYVYPSRLDYLTHSKPLKLLMHGASIVYGISSAILLFNYPNLSPIWITVSCGYIILYLLLSFYRTISPMTQQ